MTHPILKYPVLFWSIEAVIFFIVGGILFHNFKSFFKALSGIWTLDYDDRNDFGIYIGFVIFLSLINFIAFRVIFF
jgi:hypothetical protein